MRTLIKFSIPVEVGNAMAKDGTLGSTLQSILDELKPEAAYFTEMAGERGGILVVDMKESSQIPAIAEPFFLALDAKVEFRPVMSPKDLQKGGAAIEKAAKKYGR